MKGCARFTTKSPSFHVRPGRGLFTASAAARAVMIFSFLQKQEHITFVEAVEQMADRVGYRINYEGGGTAIAVNRGTQARLVAANTAAQFYAEQLRTPAAQKARDYLTERDFDGVAAASFGCGYAPTAGTR